MKRLTFILLMILALTLSACGGAASEAESADAVQSENVSAAIPESAGSGDTSIEVHSVSLTDDYENALGVQLQLSIGTFELEETELAVDAAQAVDLLPLWQVLNSLTESDTAAQEEIDALVVQIAETMTAEQIEAIAAMQLTREDMGVVMQEYGLQPEGMDGETLPEGVTPGQGRGGGSGVPGMGGGPGGGGGETGMTPEQIATAQAEREANGGANRANNRMSGVIIEGLIELLQSK